MDRTGTIIDKIVHRGPAPFDHVDDRPVERSIVQLFAGRFGGQTNAKLGVFVGVHHQPAFVFAARETCGACRIVVGVDLDRQPLRREQKFYQDRGVVAIGVGKPDFADPPAAEVAELARDIGAAPRLFRQRWSQGASTWRNGDGSPLPRQVGHGRKSATSQDLSQDLGRARDDFSDTDP